MDNHNNEVSLSGRQFNITYQRFSDQYDLISFSSNHYKQGSRFIHIKGTILNFVPNKEVVVDSNKGFVIIPYASIVYMEELKDKEDDNE